jgi:Domain of Unknown Function (DUF1259)
MQALQEGGIDQTALHNHVLHESPRIMYMHIAGHGTPVALARVLRSALGRTGTPVPAPGTPPPAPTTPAIDLDTLGVARALGYVGRVNGGVYQVSVPRGTTIMEDGMEIPPSMGVATAINFQPIGNGQAAITGDFVLTASEVNPVIRMLQAKGITVSALHSHMLGESPRLFFMHFWAKADAVTLAQGLRSALERTDARPAAR